MEIKRQLMLSALGLFFILAAKPAPAQDSRPAEIEQYSREAEQALTQHKPDEAAAALEQLARLTPDSPEVFANLGTVYYTQGRTVLAVESFQRALHLNPKIPNAEFMLGLCFAELGRNQEAVRILEPAFRHHRDEGLARLNGLELQKAYVGLRQYAKASEVFDELLTRYPDDPEILYFASRLYADRANDAMERLVEIAPSSVWVARAKAAVRESLKEYDLAILDYRTAIGIDPRQPGLHYALGRLLLQRSQGLNAPEEALHEFEQELALQPQNADTEYEIGECYRHLSQLEQALEHFSKAVQYDPAFEEAQLAIGRVLTNLDRPHEALPHLLTSIRIDPENEVSHYVLASVYRKLGDTLNSQKENALFQKLHAANHPEPPVLETREVTRQTVGSDVTEPKP